MTFKLEFPDTDMDAMLYFGKAMLSIAASHGVHDTEQHVHIGVTSGENTFPELTAPPPSNTAFEGHADAENGMSGETVAESLELPETWFC